MELSVENSYKANPNGRKFHSLFLLALSDIKLAHSVFALPFAVLAAFLATPAARFTVQNAIEVGTLSPTVRFGLQLALIVLCMFFARTWAMLVNRLADWRFDRDNPRTARRAIASGRLTPRQGWAIAAACAAAFIAATAGFALLGNLWPLALSLPVLGWIALYSYTKRFTWLCHLFLGGALAASPIAAVIAIDPAVLTEFGPTARAVILLAGFVLLWVAGFDIAYALQDLDFDRRVQLQSIPARLGPRRALVASRFIHAAAWLLLILAVRAEPRFGPMMLSAAGAVAALLIFEHVVLARRGLAGLPLAFFTLNGVVSCLLGTAGVVDILL